MSRVTKAVIPAAGKGSRFLPITKACAKELLPIIDRPVLDYILDEVMDSGITEVLLIVSPDKDNIKSYYQPNAAVVAQLEKNKNDKAVADIVRRERDLKISYVTQAVANGSGAALLLAEEFANGEPFAVLLGDDVVHSPNNPATGQLIEMYERTNSLIIGVQRVLTDDIYKYGIVDVVSKDDLSRTNALLEKPARGSVLPSNKCSLGRYVFTPEIFDAIRRTSVAANGELQLSDAINLLCREGEVYSYCFSGRRYDMGDKLGSLEGIVEYGLRSEFGEDFKKFLKGLNLK